jgi:3-isopropylmalate/(R)-2-methylmalate dehydratase small subunit
VELRVLCGKKEPDMANVVLKLGDDISTDIIYPGRFMATVLPTETPQYAFNDISEFNGRMKKGEIPSGSVIVAGKNFGCGSSREQAASCLKGPELVVIARHFARIFLRIRSTWDFARLSAQTSKRKRGMKLK